MPPIFIFDWRVAFGVGYLYLYVSFSYPLAANEITIRADPSQVAPKEVDHGRQTREKKPYFSSDSSVDDFVAEESSFQETEGARSRSSGFAIPRIRGNEAKRTSISVDGIELYDPYTGIVPAEEFDIEAYDRLSWSKGSGGSDELFGGSGTLRLGSISPRKNSLLGSTHYSTATGFKNLARWNQRWSEEFAQQTYISYRRNITPVNYYDDLGTFYNTADDRIIQSQRDSTGGTVMEKIFFERGSLRSFLLAGNISDEKLAYGATIKESTRTTSTIHNQFVGFANDLTLTPELHLRADLTTTRHHKKLRDPTGELLPFPADTSQTDHVSSVAVSTNYKTPIFAGLIRAKKTWGFLHQTNLRDESFTKRYSAERIETEETLKLIPALSLSLHAHYETIGTASHAMQQRSIGPTVTWAYGSFGTAYARYAEGQRAAPLLFLYGDAATVLPQESLESEKWKQGEVGTIFTPHQNFSTTLALFRTLTRDDIRLVLADANHFQARNIAQTDIRGVEIDSEGKLFEHFFLGGSYTYLLPQHFDLEEVHDLARTPRDYETLFTGIRSPDRKVKLLWRRQGVSFLDPQNDVKLSSTQTTDFSWDEKFGGFEVSLAILNLTNVMSQSITSADGRSGKVTRRDASGEPLLGRIYKAGLQVNF